MTEQVRVLVRHCRHMVFAVQDEDARADARAQRVGAIDAAA